MENLNIEFKKLGDNEIVKRNYAYLLLAQQNGFFQDGYASDDITTCSDWVIALWIDGLGENKKNKQKFLSEILPSFKRWFSNGLKSSGVGMHYDILRRAEVSGLKINTGCCDCIVNLIYSKRIYIKPGISEYDSVYSHFIIGEIIDNLTSFLKKGIPLCYSLSDNYDCLLKLVENGENIDFSSFIMLHTAGRIPDYRKLELYEEAKAIKEKYGYFTCNADEVSRLSNYLVLGGYNSGYVDELQDKIERCKETIYHNKKLDKSRERILKRLNRKISISYYALDENGNKTFHKVSGELLSYDGNRFVLKSQASNNNSDDIVIKDDNDTIVKSVVSDGGVTLYECRTINERVLVKRAESQIREIKKEDILSRYVDKYGTIEGLAYLKRFGSLFISTVEKGQVPIDNLFTYCFDTVSEYKSNNPKEALQYALAAYEYVMSGEIEFLDSINYGYPVNKFLSQEVMKTVTRACVYVVSCKIKADVPDVPTEPTGLNITDDTAALFEDGVHTLTNDDKMGHSPSRGAR